MFKLTVTADQVQQFDVVPDGMGTQYEVRQVKPIDAETVKLYVQYDGGFKTTLDFPNKVLLDVMR